MEELDALYSVSSILSQSLPFQQAIKQAMNQLAERFNLRIASFRDTGFDGEGDQLVGAAGDLTTTILDISPVSGQGIGQDAIRTKEILVSNDYYSYPNAPQRSLDQGIQSAMAIPLKKGEGVKAIVFLASTERNHFTPDRVRALTKIGGELESLVENARLEEDRRLRVEELETLTSFSNALSAAGSFREKVGHAMDELARSLDVAGVVLRLPDEGTELLRIVGAGGPLAPLLRERMPLIKPTEGVTGRVYSERKTLVSNAHRHEHSGERDAFFGGVESIAGIPIENNGSFVGVLAVFCAQSDYFSVGRMRVLEAVANGLGTLIATARLADELRASAVETERVRISHEMHDGLAQLLGYVSMQADAAAALLKKGDTAGAEKSVDDLSASARTVFQDVREGILALRSQIYPDKSLHRALSEYLEHYRTLTGHTVEFEWNVPKDEFDLEPTYEVQLLRIVQEALTNIRKHAEASHVSVSFGASDGTVSVTIRDNGTGFQVDGTRRAGRPHFGLQVMKERAESIGGTLEVVSDAGEGTVVSVQAPSPKSSR